MAASVISRRSATVLFLAVACTSALYGGLAGCSSNDTGTANIVAASPAPSQPVRMGAGDDLGLSLRQSDQIWAHVQTTND